MTRQRALDNAADTGSGHLPVSERSAQPGFLPAGFSLLRAYQDPAHEARSPWTTLELRAPVLSLHGLPAATTSTGDHFLRLRPFDCKTRREVTFLRYAEHDRFAVLDCDGAIAPGALDRLSVLARPWHVPRPAIPLPLQPDPTTPEGEWVPGVKLLHPRLFWLVESIAVAFPGHAIRIASGYRPGQGYHGKGRALDIVVSGIDNADVFRYCRTLPDVGCGYYPNSSFVHVDVRPPGTGHAMWIDASGPGEKAHYVDSWPGVMDHGARQWAAEPTSSRRLHEG